MIEWVDPKRWLILQYRPGTGGKFLCTAMMTLDAVRHWDEQVETGQQSHQAWLERYWTPQDLATWISHEPTIHWNTEFFSRSRDRGDDISVIEYQSLMQTHAKDWIRRAWQSGKILLDWLNKSRVPPWLQGSTLVRLDARDKHDIRYMKTLERKLFPYDATSGLGRIMMDTPGSSHINANSTKFMNDHVFGPFANQSSWLEWVWTNYQPLNWSMPPADIYFEDLGDFDAVQRFIYDLAKRLSCDYDHQALLFTHEYWCACQDLVYSE